MGDSTFGIPRCDRNAVSSLLVIPFQTPDPGLGLYIHIPFCEKKCVYCDFNTYAGLHTRFQETVDALCAEMRRWSPVLAGRTLTSLFVGGGTPTVLAPEQLAQLLAAVQTNFLWDSTCEVSCEANPGAVDRAKFQLLRELGVNRLSLGVQSFQPEELRFLGRIHDVEDVLVAYDAARSAGFTNINLDFIFGLPGQSLSSWDATLAQAVALAPEHLSLYSLIVEENTPLHHWVASGQVDAPDEDEAATLYEHAQQRLADAGYLHYEVSNWARRSPTDSGQTAPVYACRHNLLYWRNEEYLGIGPGAHSHLCSAAEDGARQGRRWGNRKPVPSYIRRMKDGEPVEEFSETIGPQLAMGETMMLGLRLIQEGVPLVRFRHRHGQDMLQVFAGQISRFARDGLLVVDEQRVRLTRQGLLVGNRVFADFLPEADTR
ncbi:MAG: coproporphyrinogen III oxidase [Chloroflexi bacterium]|nr:MAG: coproporphyrinogen III oxidase [Chloroflexota bacterium]